MGYKRNSNLTPPDDSRQRLWRYLKFDRLCQIIEEETIFFPRLDLLQDSWEGMMTAKTREALFRGSLLNMSPDAARHFVDNCETENRESFYVNCWHMNDHESYLMWKVYGDRGCAIRTTFERLVHSFGEGGPEIEAGKIKYLDYARHTNSFQTNGLYNGYLTVSHKDLPYVDEKELRLFFWKIGLVNQKYSPNVNGISIKVDVNSLIDKVYVNPAHQIDLGKLEELIHRKKLDCEIVNTGIAEEQSASL